MLNILTGIFLEKATAAAQPDRESLALEQRRNNDRIAQELLELLVEMDKDDSGTVTLEEFSANLNGLRPMPPPDFWEFFEIVWKLFGI